MALALFDRLQKLRRIRPGRAVQASTDVDRIAAERNHPAVQPFAGRAIESARHYLDLRTLRLGQSSARGDGEAARIDAPVDTWLGLVYHACRKFADEMPDSPEGQAGQHVMRRYFGQGLKAVVTAPYEEEVVVVEYIVDGLLTRDAEAAAVLHIGPHLAALSDLLPKYRAALQLEQKVTAADVGEAYEAMQVRYLEMAFAVVAFVLDPADREALLAPIFDQDDRLAALYAARRRGQTVATDIAVPDPDAEAEAQVAEELADAEAERAAEAQGAPDVGADDEGEGVEGEGVEGEGVEGAGVEGEGVGGEGAEGPRRPLGSRSGDAE